MNFLKQFGFICFLVLLLSVMLLTGCGSDDSTNFYTVEEAPGVRITAEALEIMMDSGELFTLTYTVRTS
ncbi:MAG: hypothetical protein FJ152_05835 [Firmicutes bacterium]|nr:hypothetical protein [Bacillota bacterium]